jgi:hypothetical protein
MNQFGIGAQHLLDLRMARNGPQQISNEVPCRLVTGNEQEHQLGTSVNIGESATLDFGVDKARDQVILWRRLSLTNQFVDIGGELGTSPGKTFTSLIAILRGPRAATSYGVRTKSPFEQGLHGVSFAQEEVPFSVVRMSVGVMLKQLAPPLPIRWV